MKKLLFSALFAFMFFWGMHSQVSAETISGKTCHDFSNSRELMVFWYTNGYSATNDPYNLDNDKDGYPCKVTKESYDFFLETVNGWKSSGGKWYYYLPGSKTPYKGWLNHLNSWYYLDQNGVMKTGWVYTGGKWYFLSPNGAMKTGWLQSGGVWYYLDQNGAMKTGWVKENGKWYYLEKNGVMRTAQLTTGGVTYWFDRSGAMRTGWFNLNGKWYYYGEDGPAKGWVFTNHDWYFLDQNGIMKTGWVNTGGKWYYLNASGAMKTGWLYSGGVWYYLDQNGAMATGWREINHKEYYFYSSGKMAVDTIVDGSRVGADGARVYDDPYLDRFKDITVKYGVSVKVQFLENGERGFLFFKGNQGVGWAIPGGVVSFHKDYAKLGVEVADTLGIRIPSDVLSAELDKAIRLNQSVEFENWLIDYDPETGQFWIVWGDYLEENTFE
ncbi:hypothetical protein [Neobacillus sp. NPDC093127]|uniref:hypothetical protein n=1 Tax=Neobacillus sp. NPDC093127 TaxID=3364296 RepID=UPI0038123B78